MIICIGPICIPVVWGLPFFAALFLSLKDWLLRTFFPHWRATAAAADGPVDLPERQCEEAVVAITDEADVDQLLAKKGHLLLYFTATWCGPCQRIAPVVADLSARFPDIGFVKIDVDEFSELAEKHSVQAMPTFVLVSGSGEEARLQGAQPEALKMLLCSTIGKKKSE